MATLKMLSRRALLQRTTFAAPAWFVARSFPALADDAATGLIVHERVPHNAEPPLDRLVESWITPNDLFYIRSHAPVPEIDADSFRLEVEGLVDRPLSLSLAELRQRDRRQSVVATMTCAGNRRNEHNAVKPVSGVMWQAGAIGNAEWTGIRLSDVLKQAGVKENARHVWFEGLDQVERSSGVIPFGASIPLDKAMQDEPDMPGALIATAMNGEPLSPDHGFPVRTVVPGYIGARSVKWLGKIVVSDRPSPNHYVQHAYKLVEEDTDRQWSAASPIETYVINSVTCLPADGASVAPGELTVKGYALAAGLPERTIRNVEVSTDKGRTWRSARFEEEARPYCWRLWTARVAVDSNTSGLIVRATDSAGNRQPETVPWNLKGYLFNAWHRTAIDVR